MTFFTQEKGTLLPEKGTWQNLGAWPPWFLRPCPHFTAFRNETLKYYYFCDALRSSDEIFV